MPGTNRQVKTMSNYTDKDYGILHDHCQSIARERDNSKRIITTLEARIEELEDELVLAHEALARRYTRP